MPKITFNGAPGTTHTNETGRFAYQFVASLVNTCAVCLQYHMAVRSGPWPIPIHRGCRCVSVPIAPGAESQPFVDFQEVLAALPDDQQVKAVGKANYKLIEKGVVKFADVVTPTRVRPFREVVAREKLTIPQMTRAGVSPRVARRAYETVNTPANVLARQHANQLIDKITQTGISREQVNRVVGERFAMKVGIKAGPSGPSPPKLTPTDISALLVYLKKTQEAVVTRAAMRSGRKPKPDEVRPQRVVNEEPKLEGEEGD